MQISWIRLPERKFMRKSLAMMSINCSGMSFFRQIQCAAQQLQDITPNLHGISSLHVSPVVSDQVTLDFRGAELVNTAGPEQFIDPFAEPITAFDGNLASVEINNLEDDSGHSTATRTPASIRRAGMFSPHGLKVMVAQP